MEYYQIRIPFSALPIYQLLARKHRLTMDNVELDDGKRIRCAINGSDENKKLFDEDLGSMEIYLDKIDTLIMGGKNATPNQGRT